MAPADSHARRKERRIPAPRLLPHPSRLRGCIKVADDPRELIGPDDGERRRSALRIEERDATSFVVADDHLHHPIVVPSSDTAGVDWARTVRMGVAFVWRITLLVLTALSVLSAIAGFLYLGPGGAVGWSSDFLAGSPFDSYLWPGVILLVVVGGTQLLAFVLLAMRRSSAPFFAAVAGFAMVIWIIAEQLLFRVPDVSGEWILLPVLQIVYSAIGLAELGCVLGLLGIFDRDHTTAVMRTRRPGA